MVKDSLHACIFLPLFPLFVSGGKFPLLSLLTMISASLLGNSEYILHCYVSRFY